MGQAFFKKHAGVGRAHGFFFADSPFFTAAQPNFYFGVRIYIPVKYKKGGGHIQDPNILDLFFARDEAALEHTRQKYGRSLHQVAYNILFDNHDAEEVLGDTLHNAWHAIPPKRPEFFYAYLSKITRNLSFKRWRAGGAKKRGGSQADIMLSELADTIPESKTIETDLDYNQTVRAINDCLSEMDASNRVVFVRRYFFGDNIKELCQQFKASESKIKSILFRARQKLKLHLEKEGVVI